MEYFLDDLIDRISILSVKKCKAFGLEKKEFDTLDVWEELLWEAVIKKMYEKVASFELKMTMVFDWRRRLVDVHNRIWDLEADIRAGKEGEIGLEEVGKRAIQIRDLNRERVAIRNEIVEMVGEGFKDIKVNHGSMKVDKSMVVV
jgi:hypothetical protein